MPRAIVTGMSVVPERRVGTALRSPRTSQCLQTRASHNNSYTVHRERRDIAVIRFARV